MSGIHLLEDNYGIYVTKKIKVFWSYKYEQSGNLITEWASGSIITLWLSSFYRLKFQLSCIYLGIALQY